MLDIQRLEREMSGSTSNKRGGLACHIYKDTSVYTLLESRHSYINKDIELECLYHYQTLKIKWVQKKKIIWVRQREVMVYRNKRRRSYL